MWLFGEMECMGQGGELKGTNHASKNFSNTTFNVWGAHLPDS